MTFEPTFHIHKLVGQQWRVDYYLDNDRVATTIVDQQDKIGDACIKLAEQHSNPSGREQSIS